MHADVQRKPKGGTTLANESVLHGAEVARDAPYGMPGLFRAARMRRPEAVACEDNERSLTYAALDAVTDAFADDILAATGGKRGIVALVLPRGVDMVVALLAVHKAGCWYLPVALDEPDERLASILEAAKPLLVLGDPGHVQHSFDGVRRLPVRREAPPEVPSRDLPETAPDQPVYVMFTSGSSGIPKGVLVSSAGLVNRVLWGNEHLGFTPHDRVLQLAPYTFDASCEEFYCSLTTGARLVLLPEGEHRDPVFLAQFIKEHAITVCIFVPSMLAEFLRTATAEDVRSVRHVTVGGEALSASLCADFRSVFDAELTNHYGPTETTIDLACWHVPRDITVTDRVRIGTPIDNVTLQVRNTHGALVPLGEAGELWIGGVQLALGYIGRPEATARAFPTVDGRRYYRSGDLVRCVDGELEYLGRVDQQVKIRGVRIETGEVESALTQHPTVEEAVIAAVTVPDGWGSELLAAFTTADGATQPNSDELRAHMRRLLPAAYVPSGFHKIEALPTLHSGKTDRNTVQETLRTWWNASLRRDRSGGCGACDDPSDQPDPLGGLWWENLPPSDEKRTEEQGFLSLGGHSLLAVRLLGRISEELGVKLPASVLLRDNASLARLRKVVRRAERTEHTQDGIAAAGPVPLSPGQRSLWLISKLYEVDAAAYNVVGALHLRGAVDTAALAAAVEDVVARHQALRVRIAELSDTEPVWEEVPEARPVLSLCECDDTITEEHATAFFRNVARTPLSTSIAPLMSVALLRSQAQPETACLVVSMHHLVSDQHGLDLILADLASCYAARAAGRAPLPAGRAPGFLDHLATAHSSSREDKRRDLRYWTELLADAPAESVLPFRRARSGVGRFAGENLALELTEDETARVDALCRRLAITPFALFVACFGLVLRGWLGRDTVVMGVPVSRRRTAEHLDLAGFLLGTMPLRLDAGSGDRVTELLRHVQRRCAEAVEHSAPDFETVVDALGLPTRPDDNPLFQVWVNDLSHAAPAPSFPGLYAEHLRPRGHAALFDVNFYVQKQPQYCLELIIARDRVPSPVAEHLRAQVHMVLGQVLDDPGRTVGRIRLTQDEVPAAFPEPPKADPSPLELVRSVATRMPSAPALREAGSVLSYAELTAHAEAVAARLVNAGVGPGDTVLLHGRRRTAYVWGLLGVWSAGASPALLDATLPQKLIGLYREAVDPAAELTVCDDGTLTVDTGTRSFRSAARASDPVPERAHILFTSGTGGAPSPVLTDHSALAHNLAWYQGEVRPTTGDRTVLLGGLGHDPVLRDILVPLVSGGTLVVPDPDVIRIPTALHDFLHNERITLLHATPALLELLVAGHEERPRRRLDALRVVICGGAPFTTGLARRVREVTDARLINAYGTTETPQIASCQTVAPAGRPVDTGLSDGDMVPFGRGVAGAELAVVNERGERCAVGQRGEIVVRGHHLALRYLGGDHAMDAFGEDNGVRTFWTGDMGRLDPWRAIRLDGRRDRQVLVNGFRVALGSIEAAAQRLRQVREARVVPTATQLGDQLTLLVVPTSMEHAPGHDELRRQLAAFLPEYAMPDQIEVVEQIGSDRNHKASSRFLDGRSSVDRSHSAERASVAAASAGASPGSVLARLSAVAEEALGRPMSVNGNFFDEGLDSIRLLRLHRLLARRLGHEIPVSALFAHPNLQALAAFLDEAPAAGTPHRKTPGAHGRGQASGAAADRRRALRTRLGSTDRDD